MSAPVPEIPPVLPAAMLGHAADGVGAFVAACREQPDALLYFLLNVGDGDTQLLVLPPSSNDAARRAVVVDVATTRKLPALLDALFQAGLLADPLGNRTFPLVVATHPHDDHIGGLPEFVERYGDGRDPVHIDDFWEPGYFHATPSFVDLMVRLEERPWIRRLQPTSGTTRYLDTVKITVVGPGVRLRNTFDTYGVNVNDASITLMVEFPAVRITQERAADRPDSRNRRYRRTTGRRLLLGADAQFASWAQATVDFPELHQKNNQPLARELQAARGADYLRADVFKLSHHASKHGITLELVERVAPALALISSVGGHGKYGFPHRVTVEAVREARQPTTTRDTPRQDDYQLGIHYTGGSVEVDGGQPTPLGSIGLIVPPHPRAPLRLFRFLDGPRESVSLADAREVRRPASRRTRRSDRSGTSQQPEAIGPR
jgi:beta-lactamase superfamily II metal-dependent hydrolase